MRACPSCGRLYPDGAGFCPEDGTELAPASQAPIVGAGQDARIGSVVGERYEVRRVVADGGMGRVYEALDKQGRRNVAVKILHPDIAQDDVAVERFKREFDVSRQLPHAHIVEVMDFQPTADGSFMLVMEFLYGDELRRILDREERMPSYRLVRILSQAALALDEAHARRFVHRDLKPDNLFLVDTPDGELLKILDFGSVKDKTDNAKKLTVMGTTIGSPFYMAPEQAQGLDTLDQRADVWALAAIAYECMAGQVPFRGANGPSILLEILTKEPRPLTEAAGDRYQVPPEMDRVMARAFQKSAGMRTGSVGELADAVGHAFGLEGDHRRWATTPAEALAGELEAALPGAMAKQPEAPKAGVEGDFFGDGDGLGVMEDPFSEPPARPPVEPSSGPPAPVAAAAAGPMAPAHNDSDSDRPAGVPSSGLGLILGLVLMTLVALLMLAFAGFYFLA